jgi:hypothetical protein
MVCTGKKVLKGRLLSGLNIGTIECNECGGVGVVPTEGALASWREEMEALLRYPNAYSSLSVLGDVLRRHLAAMPQPANAELPETVGDDLTRIGHILSMAYWHIPEDDAHYRGLLEEGCRLVDSIRAAIAQAKKGAAL